MYKSKYNQYVLYSLCVYVCIHVCFPVYVYANRDVLSYHISRLVN